MRYVKVAADLALGLALIYPPARWLAGRIADRTRATEAPREVYWGWDGLTVADIPLVPNDEVDRILERLA
jgi:hypothetical protein